MSEISWADFEKVDMRVGTIVDVQDFPEARNPAYKLIVDFGDLGERKTSAQITSVYSKEELMGQQVIAVVNFPPKQIGPFMSECLVMGVLGEDKDVILLKPDKDVKNGWKIG
jgi:tRNA-binding protein